MCCRIEPVQMDATQERLYIMTLGVLATWRRRGVGTQLLLRMLDTLKRYPAIHEVYLHVQTSNKEAVQFYKVRQTVVAFDDATSLALRFTPRSKACFAG